MARCGGTPAAPLLPPSIACGGRYSPGLLESLPERSDVLHVVANDFAFAAIMTDRTVTAWGLPEAGGDLHPETEAALLGAGAAQLQATAKAFAALRLDGSVVAWGAEEYGGSPDAATRAALTAISTVYSNEVAFVAVDVDGHPVAWGPPGAGGLLPAQVTGLPFDAACPRVGRVFHTKFAFFAECLQTATATPSRLGVAWGDAGYGGAPTAIDGLAWSPSTTIQTVASTGSAFAVLLSDGGLVVWGDGRYGGGALRQLRGALSCLERLPPPRTPCPAYRWGGGFKEVCVSRASAGDLPESLDDKCPMAVYATHYAFLMTYAASPCASASACACLACTSCPRLWGPLSSHLV